MEKEGEVTIIAETHKDLIWLERMADILDNKFTLPGTKFRFGIDGIIGLIPYAGDIFTASMGAVLIVIMYRKGASGKLVIKMISNVAMDAAVGTIPVIGDLFDFSFRSHRRNVNLMKEHYVEGRHQGSAWGVIGLILFFLLLIIGLVIYGVGRLIYWVVS